MAVAQRQRLAVAAGGGILLVGILAFVFRPQAVAAPKSLQLVKLEASAQRVARVTGRLERAKGAAFVLPVESPTPRAAATAPDDDTWQFSVVTRPTGASVRLDGQRLDGRSPLPLSLMPDRRYTLDIERDGYEGVRWAFVPRSLPAATLKAREIFFALVAETAPVAVRPAPSAAIRSKAPPQTPPPPARPPTPAPSIARQNLPLVKPIRVQANVEAPRVITQVKPAFPSWARDRGLTAYVVLELVIDREGRVRSATPLRSVDPELDRLAAEAARQWTFEPARSRGKTVDVLYNVAVHFEQ